MRCIFKYNGIQCENEVTYATKTIDKHLKISKKPICTKCEEFIKSQNCCFYDICKNKAINFWISKKNNKEEYMFLCINCTKIAIDVIRERNC